jgi:hypothetical protein
MVMMKRYTLISFFVLMLIATLLTACGGDNDCKSCSKVTYQNNIEIGRTPSVPYCGDELAEKESAPPVTIGDRTTMWECN